MSKELLGRIKQLAEQRDNAYVKVFEQNNQLVELEATNTAKDERIKELEADKLHLEEIETDQGSTIGFMEQGIKQWKKQAEDAEAELAKHKEDSRLLMEVLSQGGISVVGCLETMANWIDHLMSDHNCDHHGYEVACYARDLGRGHIQSIDAVKAKVLPSPAKESPEKNFMDTIKPATLLQECKWRKECVDGINCFNADSPFYSDPCSKRCDCPEPAEPKKPAVLINPIDLSKIETLHYLPNDIREVE